ncbi:unnamed protein product [Phaeothamnion confervicola]
MPTIDAEAAADLAKQSQLLDARPRTAYVGDPGKAGTGHIPGAIHALAGDNIADGKNSNRPMICTPAFLVWERMARQELESIAAAAMRRPMRSQP